MRRFVTVLTAVVAATAFSTMVFAQTATPAKPVAAAKPAAVAKPAVETQAPAAKPAAKPAKLSAKGEAKYDEATKTLTVGDKTFTLAADAKIVMGAKTMTAADTNGKNVLVTYTVVDGKDVASKVTIAAAKPTVKPVKK
jgi:hypothetical protein